MPIESIRLKNFRAFQNVHLKNIPKFCVLVGANGTGKSTLFSVFAFLRDAMTTNVTAALGRLGGSRGLAEVRSRGSIGAIEIEIKLRVELSQGRSRLMTYELHIDEDHGQPVVVKEVLQYRRGNRGRPWRLLDFAYGKGEAVTNELESVTEESLLQREQQTLKSQDILAIKGLAQFARFPAVVALGNWIENWHLSDFHISRARPEADAGYAEHLSREGDNLSLVVAYLHKHHPGVFNDILERLQRRVPGVTQVEAKTTEEGRVLLKFQDGAFQDPFLARYVSDGTIKMLAYLVLLYDPHPYPLLCVEEPENQIYPSLLWELAEEFRAYAQRGGQVFLSTHSPDFLNAVELCEVFWLVKDKGQSQVHRAADNEQLCAYMREGDQMGYLWKQGLFPGAQP
ncbi:AAA family ATPase [Candidatus Symbiobacter mobilis]|uniref:ATPase-like protein n=1 Tax=Candidatus Symbiobacter mobilis CR TaxID=946483 RepID=U5NB86_9BURK|nr:AAA family ATPase [Candidatus Symbiobacter mobilis]AGX87429.1 ATPase-like protein [Candidatus Symbiobacter mobilis CR]